MNNNKYIVIALILGTSVSSYFLLEAQTDVVPPGEPTDIVVLQEGQAKRVIEPQTISVDNLSHSKNLGNVKLDDASVNRQEIESELKSITQQLALISDVYAAEVQYPPYSKPISESSVSYLEPNYFNVVEVPVLAGDNTASLSLDKYRFFYPEPVVVSLNTKLAISNIKYELYEPETKQLLFAEQTDSKTLAIKTKESWPQEVRIKATIDFEQGTDILTADFNFFVPTAYLLSAGEPLSEGADMLIPLALDVKQGGIYRVRANLFSQDGEVIAALNGKSKLGEGSEVLELKVHQSVLAGTDGHYQLKNWVIEKMSGYPGEKASFGVSLHDAIPLAPFDISVLSKDAYTPSPEEQQRLEFLRQAANQ